MKRVLFVDDMEVRHEGFKKNHAADVAYYAWSVEEAIQLLKEHPGFDVAYLDHDLAGPHYMKRGAKGSGSEIAEFIATMPEETRPKKVVLHTWNVSAAAWMETVLLGKVPEIVRMPYNPETI